MSNLSKVSENMKKYLILYAIAALGLGWILGIGLPKVANDNKSFFANLVIVFVFFMIYPMMINMDWKEVTRLFRDPRPVLMSLLYNYAITPVIAFILAILFLRSDPDLSLGFMLVMLVPVGSSSVGYTGIVKGSVETAMIAQTINFLLIPVLTPIYLLFLARGKTVIPMGSILQSIIIVVILPMILGYITRRIIIGIGGKESLKRAQPVISIATLISTLLVIGTIFFMKGEILVTKWDMLLILGVLTIVYLTIALILETFIDKKSGLSYKDHMGIVFLSTSKNNGTAVAIATLAFNPLVAIPAAVLPLFQIVFLIVYIHLENFVRHYFTSNDKKINDKKIKESLQEAERED